MLFISPVNAVLIPFDPALDVQGINTHRHVRHPFNDRVLQFLRRLIRSITDGPQEGSSVEEKEKERMAKRGFQIAKRGGQLRNLYDSLSPPL